jgi:hypothetical protein
MDSIALKPVHYEFRVVFFIGFPERFVVFQHFRTGFDYAAVLTPCPNRTTTGKNAVVKLARRANTSTYEARVLAKAERGLHFADQLDYLIRRRIVPVPYGGNRLVTTTPLFRWSSLRKHSRGVSRPTPHRKASMRSNGLLSEVQAAIGRCLSAEYDLAQPIPNRLVDLLRQLEQRVQRDRQRRLPQKV